MNRREVLLTMVGGCATLLLGRAAETRRTRLGIVSYALGIHQRQNWAGRHAGLPPAVAFLEECHRFGAGGIQCSFGAKEKPQATEMRRRAERYEMYIEAILDAPRDEADLARFESDVRIAQEAGARVARTVVIPGRRYEQFQSPEEFREFEQRGLRSLQLAEPVLARSKLRLAVENHKDQLVAEKLAMLQRLDSEFIGLCVDVGNNFALMEDPLETVRAFAPWAFTVHLKDQVAWAYQDGFLLGDAALGEGFLDLPAMVKVLRGTKPDIRFNLETITRDPIRVPVLSETYWATLRNTPASALARTLRVLKNQPEAGTEIMVTQLPREQQLALEKRNVEHSMAYAKEKLEL